MQEAILPNILGPAIKHFSVKIIVPFGMLDFDLKNLQFSLFQKIDFDGNFPISK